MPEFLQNLWAICAADYYGYDHFLRVCGDRPFLDGEIYDNWLVLYWRCLYSNSDQNMNSGLSTIIYFLVLNEIWFYFKVLFLD